MIIKVTHRIATGNEAEYFEGLERAEKIKKYTSKFDGSYEAAKGDIEGAILARDEFNANPF